MKKVKKKRASDSRRPAFLLLCHLPLQLRLLASSGAMP
ncbi:SPATA3 isoform 9 [Pan troglodytes]|uniref:Spermatogenesis associated 3 n=2 Tax=Homininae TaxID=207598 RepID=F8WDD9_HUMAN|nr:SPATA3 isoform 9 [Pan troglodytes]